MSEITDSLYNLTQEQYDQLDSSGLGKTIYGDKFPPNFAVFLSQSNKYEIIQQLSYTLGELVDDFGLSAKDAMELIAQHGDTIGLLFADINSGLIGTRDIEKILEDSE